MDRPLAGEDAADELDFVGGDNFSARQIVLARAKSAGLDLNGTIRRGHNAMIEHGIGNDCGFEKEVRNALSQLGPMRNVTTSVKIQFQPEKGYRPSLHRGPRNAANVGDMN
jgi:hypothetical protein